MATTVQGALLVNLAPNYQYGPLQRKFRATLCLALGLPRLIPGRAFLPPAYWFLPRLPEV